MMRIEQIQSYNITSIQDSAIPKPTTDGLYIFIVTPSDSLPSGIALNDIARRIGGSWMLSFTYNDAPSTVSIDSPATTYLKDGSGSWFKFTTSINAKLDKPTGTNTNIFQILDVNNDLDNSSLKEDASRVYLDSTVKGFRPSVVTIAQRNAIATPSEGLMAWNSDDKRVNFYNGSNWDNIFGFYSRQTSQTITSFVSTILNNWSIINSIPEFNTTTGIFTASRKMTILVTAGILFNQNTTSSFEYRLDIFKNAGLYTLFLDSRPNIASGLTTFFGINGSSILSLNNGDTISIRTYHTNPTSINTSSAESANFVQFKELI